MMKEMEEYYNKHTSVSEAHVNITTISENPVSKFAYDVLLSMISSAYMHTKIEFLGSKQSV